MSGHRDGGGGSEPATRSYTAPIALATAALALVTLAVRGLGFVEKQVLAYFFGIDPDVDALFVALSLAMALFLFIRELIEPAFLPLFVQSLSDGGERRGWRLFSVAAVGIVVVTVGLAIAGTLGADRIAPWLAPGFSPATLERTASLIRITLPGGVCLGLSALTYITLNGYRRFALPASGDLALKGLPIVACIALVPQLGISALAIGFVAGAVGRLAVHGAGLTGKLRLLGWPREAADRADVGRMLALMLPLFVGVALSQVSELADNYFASQIGDGGVSARVYAKKIVDLPILLLPYALSVVLFPHFAHLDARGERNEVFRLLGRTVRAMALVFAALGLLVVVLAAPIVSLLFERGKFGADARMLTAGPLAAYGLGLVTFAIEAILVPFYYALRDTWTPVLTGIVGVIVNITLASLLVGPFGVAGVAVALVLSKTFKVIVLAALLPRKQSAIPWREVGTAALRTTAATAIAAGGLLLLMGQWAPPVPPASILSQATYLAGCTVAAFGLFFTTAYLVGVPERSLLPIAARWLRDRIRG